MKTKLMISILIITHLLFLVSCKGISREDAIFLGVGTALLGGMALYHYMNKEDKMMMQSVCENSPMGQTVGWQNPDTNIPLGQTVGWQNPDTNIPFQMTVTHTGTNNSGSYCCQYQTVGIVGGRKETMVGTACRQPNGTWKIQ